jgi:hypothetical protein
MGIRMWWRKALDSEEWRKLLMEGKSLSCRAEDDDEMEEIPSSEAQGREIPYLLRKVMLHY